MTVEHRLLFQLADITALTFECAKEGCGARLSLVPDTVSPDKVQRCPRCAAYWLDEDTDLGQTNMGVFGRLVTAIRTARGVKHPGFRLYFEFDDAVR
jgi:hypothetical protein